MEKENMEIDLENKEEESIPSPEIVTLYNPLRDNGDAGRIEITLEDLEGIPDLPPSQPNAYSPQAIKVNMNSSSRGGILSTMFAGLIGGILAFAISEAIFRNQDGVIINSMTDLYLHSGKYFSVIGLIIGLALGAIDGITSKNPMKALKEGGLGALAGIIGGFVSGYLAQMAYSALGQYMENKGVEFTMTNHMLIRAAGWVIAGILVGAGSAIPTLIGKKIVNSLIGGAIGGFLGGLLFDPVSELFNGGSVSRAVGITIIGGAMGLAIGLVENLRKEAWLKTLQGRMKGKEFIIYKERTILGSSGKCDIVLFREVGVMPNHAVIIQHKNNYSLQDLGTPNGTYINNQRVGGRILRSGDVIRLGDSVFIYNEKAIRK